MTIDVLQIELVAEKRNGTFRVNIPVALYKKYAEHCMKLNGQDIKEGHIVVHFSLPTSPLGLDYICKRIKSGDRPLPIIINFQKDSHFYN